MLGTITPGGGRRPFRSSLPISSKADSNGTASKTCVGNRVLVRPIFFGPVIGELTVALGPARICEGDEDSEVLLVAEELVRSSASPLPFIISF